ncbi:hypothetical protein DPX16_16852 [Anabarilius grahami]|uniref:Uncharacterized protein n=1 Tax=Anabarilius grahami TaxID=495550 RepID=A0A3N0YSQ8_ANAGA|nr:hypothetical protein DPX16_16852 [Anabarilius grahami]
MSAPRSSPVCSSFGVSGILRYKSSFRPSDEARDLVCFGTAGEDGVDDEYVMLTATSDSTDWLCQKSEAFHNEMTEKPSATILIEMVGDLCLSEQPVKKQDGYVVSATELPHHHPPETCSVLSKSPR